jgi:anti-sigma B factor antagonist
LGRCIRGCVEPQHTRGNSNFRGCLVLLSLEVVGDLGVIRVQGDLDALSAPQLRVAVDNLFRDGVRSLMIDCRAIDFIDSSGLRELLHAHQAAHERSGTVTVRRPSPFTCQLLQITGLDVVLQVDSIPDPSPQPEPTSR